MKSLIWDDDILIIADDNWIKFDIDTQLGVLKKENLEAALKELDVSDKQICLTILAVS
jgi:hypothetical protein